MSYAAGTNVSDDRSRSEIEGLLMKYGADEFGYLSKPDAAMIGFKYRGLQFQMSVPMPKADDPQFTRTPGRGQARSQQQAWNAYTDERKRRWRSLCLVIKAKLVAIEDKVATFEHEFLPYLVTSTGETVGMRMTPLIRAAIERGDGVLMLPAPGSEKP